MNHDFSNTKFDWSQEHDPKHSWLINPLPYQSQNICRNTKKKTKAKIRIVFSKENVYVPIVTVTTIWSPSRVGKTITERLTGVGRRPRDGPGLLSRLRFPSRSLSRPRRPSRSGVRPERTPFSRTLSFMLPIDFQLIFQF